MRLLAGGILLAATALYGVLLARTAPVNVEFAHLGSAVSIWQTGWFEDYPVNPPLVKLAAAAPVLPQIKNHDWRLTWLPLPRRNELSVGYQLAEAHPDRWYRFLVSGRLPCALLSAIGIWVCWRWARQLYGAPAAWFAALGLALEPNFLSWSVLISTDAPAAAMGILAAHAFWRWLRAPGWGRALLLGAALALALLTKFTWLVLPPLLAVLWLVWQMTGGGTAPIDRQRDAQPPGAVVGRWAQFAQLLVAGLLALYLVNSAYGFEGSFQPLKSYRFYSRSLAGPEASVEGGRGGNRWQASWVGAVPVPVPRAFLTGIDLQKIDFERNWEHYINGRRIPGGAWYFYPEALALKVPLGIWCVGLVLLCRGVTCGPTTRTLASAATGRAARGVPRAEAGSRATWRDELVLVCPMAAVLVLLMANPQVAYLRYALPAFPFAFVYLSQALARWQPRLVRWAAGACLCWAVCGSLAAWPHNMSYFNELAGGPLGGPRYLLDAQVDWGQDIFHLVDWRDRHPQAAPLLCHISSAAVPMPLLGLQSTDAVGAAKGATRGNSPAYDSGPLPGWYAISVGALYDPTSAYAYFREFFQPVDRVGYSIQIFNVTPEDARRARQALGYVPIEEF